MEMLTLTVRNVAPTRGAWIEIDLDVSLHQSTQSLPPTGVVDLMAS